MLMRSSNPSENPRGWALFIALQIVLLAVGTAWAARRVLQASDARALPTLLDTPRTVRPLYDNPLVVSDEQLLRVLRKLRPRNMGAKTKINHIDHALRFWGVEAKFNDPQFFDGEDLRRVLTDNRRFLELFGKDTPPLLLDAERGVRVRTQEGGKSASHVDHTLTSLAEVGTPLDFPVYTPTQQTTYRAILDQTLADFALNQTEYEWTTMSFALYFAPHARFVSSEGQKIDFDLLARREMRQELPQGVCFANHRLYGLVLLLRIDDETPLLSKPMRAEVLAYLAEATQRLVRSQHADGYWDGNWPEVRKAGQEGERTTGDAVSDRILATGHALEWWAMAPAELHPPRDTLARAGQWLVRAIDDLTPEKTEDYFTFLSHAGRSLALWRNTWPHEVLVGK